MAKDFVEKFEIDFPVFTDPRREAYLAAGCDRGWYLKFSSVTRAWTAFKAGHRQGKTMGDPQQQGGELLVLSTGEVAYRRPTDGPGNHAEPDELKRVIDAVRSGSETSTPA